ncbi:MAG: DNA polymerase III subunit gamma/tau [Bacteroidetes bacterium]|nr:MAG: DNA polymerase III subunit gamma/tau [Bacteroidota bacterium]TAE70638.1 MAG: DNA polymerase III subunit gamma/tau [Bacteroidota bacterium]TAF93737.1 MAG: DNA polymerase III subunit gamma/tau [Bacteroidota bacterium]
MEKFLVSARKYRPQNFSSVVGQQHITNTLKNAIQSNHLAHAFLFCGPRGVGKTTCARIFAKTINCENLQPNGEACNTCNSCVSFEQGTSFNVHELDAASNNSVDDIRALVEQVRFAPQAGTYKVYIVDEVHMLSTAAFNAFLKTLEEPPAHAKFILATTEKHKILPTILSRCQIFDFKRITLEDTVQHLQEIIAEESYTAEKAALQIIAQKSEGCMRDALSIMDKIASFSAGAITYANTLENLNILDEDYFFKILDAIQQQDISTVLLTLHSIDAKGFEGDTFLGGFATCLRNLLVCKDAKALSLLEVVDGKETQYKEYATTISTAWLVSALQILADAEYKFQSAKNKKLHVELCLVKLTFLQQAITLSPNSGGKSQARKAIQAPQVLKIQAIQNFSMPKAAEAPTTFVVQEATPVASMTSSPTTAKKFQTPPPIVPAVKPAVVLPLGAGPAGSARLSVLEKLRASVAEKGRTVEPVKNPEPLQLPILQQLIQEHAARLEAAGKYTAKSAFESAEITIENDENFMLAVHSYTHKKSVDDEKFELMETIYAKFFNKAIMCTVQLNQAIAKQQLAAANTKYLNLQQRVEKAVAANPLVAQLIQMLNADVTNP